LASIKSHWVFFPPPGEPRTNIIFHFDESFCSEVYIYLLIKFNIKDLNFLCSTNENLLQMFDNEKIDSLFNCLGAASYDIENLILI